MSIFVPISPGELVDKLTILELKATKLRELGSLEMLRDVQREREQLRTLEQRELPASAKLGQLRAELAAINGALWAIEDDIREHERTHDFGARFVELARSVYMTNDRRAAVKREINELLGSELREHKAYASY